MAFGYSWSGRKKALVGTLTPPVADGPGTPAWPATGTYDPTIKLNADAAGRGLGDTLADYITNYGEPGTGLGGRAGYDYTQGRDLAQRSGDRSLSDLSLSAARAGTDFTTQRTAADTSYGNSLADLLTSRTRAGEDHSTALANLGRQYTRLGHQQTNAARAAGVAEGGTLAQALAKRTENQTLDQQPIDQSFSRFMADSTQGESRLGAAHQATLDALQTAQDRFNQDNATSVGRVGEDVASQLGGLDTQYLRGGQDALTQLTRAGRENTQFQLGSQLQAAYEAGPQDPVLPVKKRKVKR